MGIANTEWSIKMAERWIKIPSKGSIVPVNELSWLIFADTNPENAASKIVEAMNSTLSVSVQATGIDAIYQATKAIAVALDGLRAYCKIHLENQSVCWSISACRTKPKQPQVRNIIDITQELNIESAVRKILRTARKGMSVGLRAVGAADVYKANEVLLLTSSWLEKDGLSIHFTINEGKEINSIGAICWFISQ